MKYYLLIPFLCIIANQVFAQDIDTNMHDIPTNSFIQQYQRSYSNLKYFYIDSIQTHNYSNNWDFDGDGKTDSLYFVGTHGAHLYYYVSIVLSSNYKTKNFEFLELDTPYLGDLDLSMRSMFDSNEISPQFIVNDFTNDGLMDIYVHLNEQPANYPKKWKRKGLTSNQILITYQKKHLALKNFR